MQDSKRYLISIKKKKIVYALPSLKNNYISPTYKKVKFKITAYKLVYNIKNTAAG